ncbi:MAG: gliding motility-associated C-terminal domain-containing protein [Bacteroidetes bacterium]|nr:gliding motility-associated C-terminal domain-containing protein [Bacteroidota bacterium]
MPNLNRILSFVPPMFLFFIPAFAQLNGTIEQLPGNSTYTVSVIPSVNWSPPLSVTSSAQVNLRATTGKLQLSDFQSIMGVWIPGPVISAPSEAPGYDYFSFSLQSPIPNITYDSGVPVALFSFKNTLGCSYVEIIDNQTDPFVTPNSQNVNIGNFFSIIGAGLGVNAYQGNAAQNFVSCPPLGITASATNNPVPCNGDVSDISVQASGGVEPYSVSWSNTTGGTSGTGQIFDFEGVLTLAGMEPGNYVFTIEDSADSLTQTMLALVEPAPLSLELGAYDASCNGSLDGVAFVDKINGGTVVNDYQYSWNANPGNSTETLNAIDPGTYTVTVTDDNGCSISGSVTVGSFVVIFPNPVIKDVTCFGEANGIVDLYPVSPNPPFSFQWSPNVTTGNFSSAYLLGPGTYSVTITDATGVCYEAATYTITEPPAIGVDYKLTEPVCFGENGQLEILAVSNAVAPWSAEIIGGGSVGNGAAFELEPGKPLRLVVEDAKGCKATEDFLLAARQEMLLELGESHDIKYGERINFAPVYFPFDNVVFNWAPTDGLSCSDCPNPVATPVETITYHLEMTDTAGCSIADFVNVAVRKSRDIYIPNTFSPNHDGVNDFFFPYGGLEIVAVRSMFVFDRWGGKIFEASETFSPNNADAGWDGLAKNKPADTGTYLYTMNVEFIDGEIILFSGEVNLMR